MTVTVRELTAREALARADMRESDNLGRASRDGSKDAWGGGSFADVLATARSGYTAGIASLRARLNALPPTLRPSMRPMPVWGVTGTTVDVGRFLSGEPDCMVSTMRGKRHSLVIKLGIERAVSAYTTPDDMLATGASVLAVVERLRTAGVASEVWVTFTQRTGADVYQLRVRVQDAGRPVDLATLAFWTMHPGALRRIGFAVEEMEPAHVRRLHGFSSSGGYGHPTMLTDGFDEYAPADAASVEAWITDVLGRRA